MKRILLVLVVAAFAAVSVPAAFADTITATPVKPAGVQVPKAPKGGDASHNSVTGEGGGGVYGCWQLVTSTGTSDWTGSYRWNFNPVWCYAGDHVSYLDNSNRYPYVSGWYSFAGDDGAWVSGGCVGCGSVSTTAQGRFAWTSPVIGWISNYTARICVYLGAGVAFTC